MLIYADGRPVRVGYKSVGRGKCEVSLGLVAPGFECDVFVDGRREGVASEVVDLGVTDGDLIELVVELHVGVGTVVDGELAGLHDELPFVQVGDGLETLKKLDFQVGESPKQAIGGEEIL